MANFRSVVEPAAGVSDLPVNLDEYAAPIDLDNPAAMVPWVSAIERNKVDGDLAYWRVDGSLGDSVAQQNTPNAQWWLFNAYTRMTGDTVAVTPPSGNADGTGQAVATLDPARRQAKVILSGGRPPDRPGRREPHPGLRLRRQRARDRPRGPLVRQQPGPRASGRGSPTPPSRWWTGPSRSPSTSRPGRVRGRRGAGRGARTPPRRTRGARRTRPRTPPCHPASTSTPRTVTPPRAAATSATSAPGPTPPSASTSPSPPTVTTPCASSPAATATPPTSTARRPSSPGSTVGRRPRCRSPRPTTGPSGTAPT